ncbi:MAG: hypothetical protein JHD15_02745 [Phenylobacterium sp.]|jgi:hypothetical protein|uniref:hypothetical protein n=1 Tax=unclassified Phenylobacterium TaxID=2640670 RepID=UPI0008B12108|nr:MULTISPECIES: hypothetical protein [unclassified Phenylobacterium]MBJ7409268.1 hypothetical protein [Phenylobacterium sp.]OHB26752.1 MAG: hypothetical protein A2790_18015 [Phenylobacterium sp. RIFCSPHIGHO2_01_FULL_69_31]
MSAKPLLVLAVAALALTACAKKTTPPGDAGICYHVVPQKDGSLKYNKLVQAASLEQCAANLEAMRIKFLTLGGNQQEIYGAYQANFLFLVKEGVMTSTSLEGPRYVALVRTGDGRLAIPGAMPQ